MNCEIIVNISRSSLQVYYSQNSNAYKLFEYDNAEIIPFYVFSDGNNFEVGTSAKIKHQNHVANSYFNYFELVKDTKLTFPFLDGEDKKISFLLVTSVEVILNSFLNDILLSSDRIADLRETLQLNLVFSSDIQDNEINFIGGLFKDYGYKKTKCLYRNYLILNYLDNNRKIGAFKQSNTNMGAFKGYITIDAIDNNLHIDFFDSLKNKYPKIAEVGDDLASDPKVKIIAKLLYEKAANATGSLTSETTEIPHLIPLAQKHAESTKSEFRVNVVLTDGAEKNVKIKMSNINERLAYLSNFTKDSDLVNTVMNKSKIGNMDLAFVVKNSVKSKNFVDKLKSTFNNIYHSNDELIDVLELFINNKEVIEQGNFMKYIVAKPSTPKPPGPPAPPAPPVLPPIGVKPKPGSTQKKSSAPPKAPGIPSLPPLGVKPKSGSAQKSSAPPKAPPPLPPLGVKPKSGIKSKSGGRLPPPPLPPIPKK